MSLGAVEKQAVLDQYLLIKTRNYTRTLQKFVTERFQKQESANNIRQLISRRLGLPSLKRKRTVNISLEVIKAAQSVLFDRTKPFSIQGQFCIQFSPILSKAINSGTINKRVIIYCLTKLDKANGYPPRCTKRNKTSHSSSELLQEPGATAAVVQAEGGGR